MVLDRAIITGSKTPERELLYLLDGDNRWWRTILSRWSNPSTPPAHTHALRRPKRLFPWDTHFLRFCTKSIGRQKKAPIFFFSGWYWASHSIGHLPDDEGIIRAKLQSGTLSRITIWDQQLEGQHTYICLGLGRLQISFSSPLRSDCECNSYCRSKQYLKRNLRTVIARESPYLKSTWWSSKC